ncbi:MAG: hypothetical protein PXX77_05815 [Gallionella sp.]|nr:hypothetical protein [Gallionella sp.]
MKILDDFAKLISSRNEKTFEGLPSWILGVLGALAFLCFSYFGLMYSDVVPDFIKEINTIGINLTALKIAFVLAIYSFPTWWFGCVAARCHTVLYERWFK